MIRIIKGSYGYHNGISVRPITAKDGPIGLSPEKEARLVRIGVAEYVTPPEVAKAAPSHKEPPKLDPPEQNTTSDESAGSDDEPASLAYSMEMTRAQLEEYAASIGVDVSKAKNKGEIIKALDEAAASADDSDEDEDEDDDGDAPPELDAVDPV